VETGKKENEMKEFYAGFKYAELSTMLPEVTLKNGENDMKIRKLTHIKIQVLISLRD
jgi:hypothetical protein